MLFNERAPECDFSKNFCSESFLRSKIFYIERSFFFKKKIRIKMVPLAVISSLTFPKKKNLIIIHNKICFYPMHPQTKLLLLLAIFVLFVAISSKSSHKQSQSSPKKAQSTHKSANSHFFRQMVLLKNQNPINTAFPRKTISKTPP